MVRCILPTYIMCICRHVYNYDDTVGLELDHIKTIKQILICLCLFTRYKFKIQVLGSINVGPDHWQYMKMEDPSTPQKWSQDI